MKRLIATAITLLLLLALPCSFATEGEASMEGKIVILHTNDTHGHAMTDPDSTTMGFTVLSALKNKYEEQGATVLTVDAGDTFHGMPVAQYDNGGAIAELMNALGYDVMTIGNHDFNYGRERLSELVDGLDFAALAANVTYTDTGEAFLDASTIVEANGVKFGFFGLATPECHEMVYPAYIEGLTFGDPIEAAREQVALLEAQDVDFIVAVGHIGVDAGTEIKSTDIIEAVDGIDIFVDGHSHTVLESGQMVDSTLLVQTGYYFANIGVVTIDTDGSISADLVNYEEFSETDPEIDSLCDGINAELDAIMGEVVAVTDVYLEGTREIIRKSETNLGDLITDAMLNATDADLAIINSGGIRASIEAGDITRGDILTVLPFSNFGVTKHVTGAEIMEMLEISVSIYPELSGEFLQMSGIEFTFDPSLPVGERVVDSTVKIGGEVIDLQREYLLVTNDYIAYGNTYTMIVDNPRVMEFGLIDEMVTEYINSLDSLAGYAEAAERIVAASESPNPPQVGDADMWPIFAVLVVAGIALAFGRAHIRSAR